ncbi:hypothetical protein RF11_00409 [Thelohanellus kitauei]|uniref:Uncharacterized protein n=1 Tax=Thelohanellus kitauei TaxID=669202 RepID=A0A0C2N761_THEKT|nr:hypothetical protein RF11_00409 [Thelohanellus kitauei]
MDMIFGYDYSAFLNEAQFFIVIRQFSSYIHSEDISRLLIFKPITCVSFFESHCIIIWWVTHEMYRILSTIANEFLLDEYARLYLCVYSHVHSSQTVLHLIDTSLLMLTELYSSQ